MSTPFMQLYVADYLGDTRHLTTEQHGAYLLLLMTMWRADGEIAADDTKLARIVGLSVARWNRIKGDVMALLICENGMLTQKRLRTELQKAQEKSQKRADAGRNGGNAKALKDNKPAVANATVLPQHLLEPEPEVIKEEEETSAAVPAAVAPPPPASKPRPSQPSDLFEIPAFLDRRGNMGAQEPDLPRVQGPPPPPAGAEIVALVPQPEREVEAAVEVYNLTATFAATQGCAWAMCEHLTDTRRTKLKLRLKECGGLDGWKAAMRRAVKSSHLLGKKPRKAEHANWKPGLDFFLQQSSFTRLMEGQYDDTPGTAAGGGSQLDRIAAAARFASSAGD